MADLGILAKMAKKGTKPPNYGSKYEGPNSLIEANMALGGGLHTWAPGTPDLGSLAHVPGGVQTPKSMMCIMMSSMCIINHQFGPWTVDRRTVIF